MNIAKQAPSLEGLVITGRTHLMDAMPIDFSQELSGWSSQLKNSKETLIFLEKRLLELPLGGTAIGTGINAHPRFAKVFAKELSKLSGGSCKCVPSDNFFHELSAQDTAVQVSGELKNLAIILMKKPRIVCGKISKEKNSKIILT